MFPFPTIRSINFCLKQNLTFCKIWFYILALLPYTLLSEIIFTDNCCDQRENNHNSSLVFYSQQIAFCYHIGILLFSNELYKFSQWISDTLARQFLVTVLLGAKNIEQTKILDFSALRAILGIVTSNRFIQRSQLSQMATENNIKELLKFNAQIINAHQYTDFYYDTHVG